MKTYNIVPRVLLCPLAGIGFLVLTSLARLLGGLLTETRPIINWIMIPNQLPMPVTVIVFMLLVVIGRRESIFIMGAGCSLGAVLGGWANNLPVDYSNGWPMNYRGGYVDGGMLELVIAVASILLAAAVSLLVLWLRRHKEKRNSAAASEYPVQKR